MSYSKRNANGQATSANSEPVVIASDQSAVATTQSYGSTDYYPKYNRNDLGAGMPNVDPFGSLQTRGAVLTDEGTTLINFTGSSLTRSIGDATFTAGSYTVTGTGFVDTYDLHAYTAVKLDADDDTAWAVIYKVESNTQLTLISPYAGAGGTGASSTSPLSRILGTGGSASVANGQLTIATGTTADSQTLLYSPIFNGPAILQASFSVSQRIANQTFVFGYERAPFATITQFARFRATGTNSSQIICETAYNPTTSPSAAETETTTVTIPAGDTTATQLTYKIEFELDRVIFSIGNSPTTLQVVATHTKRIPHFHESYPYGSWVALRTLNGSTPPAGSTNFVFDYAFGRVFNRLDTVQTTPGDGTNSQVVQQKYALTTSDILQSGATATGNGVSLNVEGHTTVVATVTISATATVTFEGTEDNGTTWVPLNANRSGFDTVGTTATTTGAYTINVAGFMFMRARISSYGSGTVTVTAHATPQAGPARVINANLLAGSAAIGTVGVTSISAGTNLIGDVSLKPRTSGGGTTFHLVSAASTNATNIKASAGQVYGYQITNTNAATRKVAFHNTAGTPTAGSSVAWSVVVPANSQIAFSHPLGIAFATGIAITTVTETADSGSTGVGSGDLNINIWYN